MSATRLVQCNRAKMTDNARASVRRHWDTLAHEYDAAKARNAGYYRLLQRAIGEAVPGAARRRVLEVGCGTGRILASLRPHEGVGIDLSEPMIERAVAQHRDRPELSFHVRDAVDLTSCGTFSAVVSTDLLEHVPDWPDVVRAMVGACEGGGVIVIITPNPRWSLPLWLLEQLRLKMPEGPHRFVAAREIANELASCGCPSQSTSTHGLVPAELWGIGPRMSRLASRLPLLGRIGVMQRVVARR